MDDFLPLSNKGTERIVVNGSDAHRFEFREKGSRVRISLLTRFLESAS